LLFFEKQTKKWFLTKYSSEDLEENKNQKAVVDILSFIEAYHLKSSECELGQKTRQTLSRNPKDSLSGSPPTLQQRFRVFDFFLFRRETDD
jgi:hypothetical protein